MSFKKVLKVLGWILISSFFIIIVMSFFALQSSPHISNRHTVDVKAATQSKEAAKRLVGSIKNRKQPVIIELSQNEANGLSALANRAFPRVVSDFSLTKKQASFDLSLELPLPLFIKYLNISGDILPSENGLSLGNIDIGSLTLPGNFIVSVGTFVVNIFVQDDLGSKLKDMVQWVKLTEGQIKASLSVPKEMAKLNNEKSALVVLRDKLSLFGDVEHIKFYYNALVNKNGVTERFTSKNLSYYLQYMFQLAKKQTLLNQQQSDESLADKENYAALMALSLYFGADTFELLVGNVSQLTSKQREQRLFLQSHVKLRNRVDLQKHFIYSIALQLFGSTTASDTIGEFKEFLDSNPGGSGFSFADLTADRAGTRLAQLATQTDVSGSKVQLLFNGKVNESDFMPDISSVPEGISAKVFEKEYRNVSSSNYQKMLALIDSQLASLVLYKNTK